MATLLIQEYEDLALDGRGNVIQAGREPGVSQSPLTTSGTTAKSAAFQSNTHFVRIVSGGIEHLAFGNTDITATTNSATRIEADTPEFFGVKGGDFVAAINGT